MNETERDEFTRNTNIPKYRDKNWLQYQYLVKLKSLGEIALECTVSRHAIWEWAERLGIKRRTSKESKNNNNLGDCKYCPKCECIHLKTYFFKNKNRYDGLTAICKSCMVESYAAKGRQYRNKVAEKYRMKHRTEYNRRMADFNKTKAGMENMKKGVAKRKRNLKWIPLMMNIYPDELPVDWHHINNFFIIPIPKITHNCFNLGPSVDKHRCLCNDWINKNIIQLNVFGLGEIKGDML